jgi:hypothetical protein
MDLHPFASALAAELPGTLIGCYGTRAEIAIDDDLKIVLRCDVYGDAGKVRVTAAPRAVLGDDAPHYSEDAYRMPAALVSPHRSIAAIAGDVTRRVVTPAAAPLKATLAYAAARRGERCALEQAVARLREASPETFVESSLQPSRYERRISFVSGLDATVYSSGHVRIDRVPIIRCETLVAILALLRGPPQPD